MSTLEGNPEPEVADGTTTLPGQAAPRTKRWAGYAAAVCALLFAVPSIYWGLGGILLLDTVGREAVELSQAGDAGIFAAAWFATLVKVGGGVLALALVQPWGRRLFPRWLLLIGGWGSGLALVLYGAANIGTQLMVLSGILDPPGDMDWRGFYGHLFVWDPWFIVWGVLMLITALHFTRDGRMPRRAR